MKKVVFTVNVGKYAGKEIIEFSSASIGSLELRALSLGWTLKSVGA